MSDAYVLRPDRGFAKAIMRLGGRSLKQCYQCATCSVTCALSSETRPFPRKEMIWAQWGLKEKLLGDSDVWLCHRCSDCTVHCPRGAAPGDVLAAVRDYAIRHYAVPAFMGVAMGRPGLLPVMLVIPAILIVLVVAAFGHLGVPEGPVDYAHFFPHLPLQVFFGGLALLALVAAVISAMRFWNGMTQQVPPNGSRSVASSFAAAVKVILTHAKFRSCTERRGRFISHLLTFYGFGGLFVTTILVVVSAYIFHYYPLPLLHPFKILGNLSTLALTVGVIMIISDRSSKSSETSTATDWSFIWILATVAVTGFATQVLRFANVALAAYPVYLLHLVVVFALLIYLPYSRFAHMIYRTVALAYADYSGRELPGSVSRAG